MRDVLCIYPPFTQPTMIYPAPYVIASTLEQAGLSVGTLDLNLSFFRDYLDPLCAATTDGAIESAVRRCLKEIELSRSLLGSAGTRPSGRQFFERLNSGTTYSDYDSYLASSQAMNGALYAFGRVIGYRNLALDTFEADASLDEPESVAQFIRQLSSSELSSFLLARISAEEIKQDGIFCISASFRTQTLPAILLLGLLRQQYPQSFIAIGGASITCLRDDPLELQETCSSADLICFGQGEHIMANLALKWFQGEEIVPTQPNRSFIINGPRRRPRSTEIKKKARPSKQLVALTDYIARNHGGRYCAVTPYFPLPAARGCYWNRCTFCFEYGNGSKSTMATVEEVCEAIELGMAYGFRHFFIGEGAVPPWMAKGIGERLHARGLSAQWLGFFRLEKNMTPEVVEAMAGGGCRMAIYGLESAVQHLQNDMKKGVLVNKATELLRVSAAAGVWNHVLLMFGYPTETEADAQETVAYVERYQDRIHSLAASTFTLDKSSELYLREGALPPTVELDERNRRGMELFVRHRRTNAYDVEYYRAKVLQSARDNLAMQRVPGLLLGHELMFHERVVGPSTVPC